MIQSAKLGMQSHCQLGQGNFTARATNIHILDSVLGFPPVAALPSPGLPSAVTMCGLLLQPHGWLKLEKLLSCTSGAAQEYLLI